MIVRPICRSSGLVLVAAAVATWDAPAQGQYSWEFAPRTGEHRMSYDIFKASHNSYQRSESYAEQLWDYNCWCLELDIVVRPDNGSLSDKLTVGHTVSCSGTPTTLKSHLQTIVNSSPLTASRPTLIWLEYKGACDNPTGESVADYLVATMTAVFPAGAVYTPNEFLDSAGDAAQWPSWQELVRRGKRWFIVAEKWPGSDRPDNYFKVFCEGCSYPINPPSTSAAFTNNYENDGSSPLNGSWMSRGYPDPTCGPAGGVGLESVADWNNGVNSPFNFVATNCISNDHTNDIFDTRIHPPQPCFVRRNDTGQEEHGTEGFPFWGIGNYNCSGGEPLNCHGLVGAIRMIERYGYSGEVWIESGDYNIPQSNVVMGSPVVLRKWSGNGSAVLR